jgi:hypothetical protein
MALSKVEAFVFGGEFGHFVTAFEFAHGRLVIEFKPMEDNRQDRAALVVATFADAVMIDSWNDPEEAWEFPLDPIGFESESSGDRWKFTLFCGTVERNWESAWPTLSNPRNSRPEGQQ